MKFMTLVSAAALAGFVSGAAFADTATPAKATPAALSEAEAECSQQADAKGLHLQKRKKFRAECIKLKTKEKK